LLVSAKTELLDSSSRGGFIESFFGSIYKFWVLKVLGFGLRFEVWLFMGEICSSLLEQGSDPFLLVRET